MIESVEIFFNKNPRIVIRTDKAEVCLNARYFITASLGDAEKAIDETLINEAAKLEQKKAVLKVGKMILADEQKEETIKQIVSTQGFAQIRNAIRSDTVAFNSEKIGLSALKKMLDLCYKFVESLR